MKCQAAGVLLPLIFICCTCADRSGKLLNVFNIVKFPNDACSSGENYGSCYTGQNEKIFLGFLKEKYFSNGVFSGRRELHRKLCQRVRSLLHRQWRLRGLQWPQQQLLLQLLGGRLALQVHRVQGPDLHLPDQTGLRPLRGGAAKHRQRPGRSPHGQDSVPGSHHSH